MGAWEQQGQFLWQWKVRLFPLVLVREATVGGRVP